MFSLWLCPIKLHCGQFRYSGPFYSCIVELSAFYTFHMTQFYFFKLQCGQVLFRGLSVVLSLFVLQNRPMTDLCC